MQGKARMRYTLSSSFFFSLWTQGTQRQYFFQLWSTGIDNNAWIIAVDAKLFHLFQKETESLFRICLCSSHTYANPITAEKCLKIFCRTTLWTMKFNFCECRSHKQIQFFFFRGIDLSFNWCLHIISKWTGLFRWAVFGCFTHGI